jgi:hypothetical protein
MATLLSKSIYCSRIARMVLLGLAALGGAASPLFGQDTVAGRFTLTENTRFGYRILLPSAFHKPSIRSAAGVSPFWSS